MDIVLDDQPIPCRSSPGRQVSNEVILGDLDGVGFGVEIVLRVEVKVDDVVSQTCHISRAVLRTRRVGRAHVRREEA